MFPRMLLSLFLLTIAISANAQSAVPASSTPPQEPPVPRIVKKTQLVYVPVIVSEKHGRHIAGLTKDAFTVEQDGKPQPIAIFEEVAKATAIPKSTRTLPEGYVENFSAPTDQAHRVMIVVLDTLNTPFLQQRQAREELIRFLQKSLNPDLPISLMVLNSKGLHQVHEFSTDPSVLINAVKKVQSRMSSGEHADAELAAAMGDANDPTADAEANALMNDVGAAYYDRYVQMEAARTTLRALEQMAGAFQGVAGRKTVIWASSGFPFTFADPQSLSGFDTDLSGDYERALDVLNNANMSIYSIDMSGLLAPFTNPGATGNFRSPNFNRRGVATGVSPNAPRYNIAQQKQDTLKAFAESTGGRAFLNSNDFEKAFETAAEDGSSYYVVAYYLHDNDKPGWHKLKVHVRAPHAEVRAREGFLVPSPSTLSPKSRLLQLAVATLSPTDYTGLHFGMKIEKPMVAKAEPLPTKASLSDGSKRAVPFHLHFPVGMLGLDLDQNNLISLDMLAVALLKDDKEAGERIGGVRAHLKPESLASFQKGGLGFDDQIELPPGEYDLRVAVRDNVSGNTGTVRSHLVVQ